ncbi:hypothetical protein NOVOSPHI9U_470021 [Novosphingobium sp. 9U]|nr:hypothetical protein NOVOSPHI9U_470021 [Novosphingobium sp. 9U]
MVTKPLLQVQLTLLVNCQAPLNLGPNIHALRAGDLEKHTYAEVVLGNRPDIAAQGCSATRTSMTER